MPLQGADHGWDCWSMGAVAGPFLRAAAGEKRVGGVGRDLLKSWRLGAGDPVRPSLSRTGSGFSPGCGSSSASVIQVLSTRRSLEGRTQSWLVRGVASGCSSADSRLPWGQASCISWQQ